MNLPDEPIDKVTLCRELLRKNDLLSAKEVLEALDLANLTVAKEILKSARRAEIEMAQAFADEDKAAVAPKVVEPEPEPKIFLKTKSGISYLCKIIKETSKMVVLELEDETVQVNQT